MSYQTQPNAPSYDVFVSYSRMDGLFVERLVRRLESFAPPKALGLPTHRLKVFVDTEDLYGSEYYGSIERALRSATKLIVVCSPHARASAYVNDEIKRFLANPERTAADVVPVLYAGVPNNEACGPEDEARKALPDLLYEIMEMPLAVDFRGFDSKRHQIGGGAYRNPWFTLLATLLDVNRDELEEREYRRVRRRRFTIGAIVSTVILALSVLSAVALWQRNEAIDQRRRAYARQLAAQAQVELADTIAPAEQSVLRVLTSLQLDRTEAAIGALKSGMARLPPRLVTRLALGPEDNLPLAPHFSPDGKRLLGVSKTALLLWNTNDGVLLLRHAIDGTPIIRGITTDSHYALVSVLPTDKGELPGPAYLLLIDIKTLKVHKASFDRLLDAIVTKEGPLALATDPDGRHLRVYDPVREQMIGEAVLKRSVKLGGLHPLQDRMALVDANGRVSLRNRRLDKVITSFDLSVGAKPIAFGWQAGQTDVLAVTSAKGDLEIYDLQRGATISQLPKNEAGRFVSFSAGDRLLIMEGPDGHRHLHSIGGNRLLTLEHSREKDWNLGAMGDVTRQMPIIAADASEDGTVLITARKDGRISVWQPALEPKYGAWGAMPMPSFRNIAHFDHGDDLGLTVVWAGPPTLFVSQSGRHIASQSMGLKANAVGGIVSYRPMVRIWHLRWGSEIARFYPRGGMQLAFAPAGDLLVTLLPPEEGEAAKGRLALWRLSPVRARVERTRREAPSGLIETGASPTAFGVSSTVAVSPDGRRAVWLAADGQLRVWNAETRRADPIDDLRPVSRSVFERIKREPTPSNPLLQSGDAEPGTPKDPLAQLIEKQAAKNRPDAAISLFPLVVSGDGCCALIAVGPLLRVYRLDTGRLIAERTLANGQATEFGGLALSHDGQVFAAATTNWQSYQSAALEFKNSKKRGDSTPILPSYVQVIHVFSVDKAKSLGTVSVTQPMIPPLPAPVILPMAVTVDSHGRWLGVRRIIQDREASLSLSFKIQFAVVSITDGATLFETPVKKWSWNPTDLGSMQDLNTSSAAFSADGRRLVIEASSAACITKSEITASWLEAVLKSIMPVDSIADESC
jgi:WD40 repeat protein